MSIPHAPEDLWEEYEAEDEIGTCSECKEHSHAVYQRHRVSGELDDKQSACCSAGISNQQE